MLKKRNKKKKNKYIEFDQLIVLNRTELWEMRLNKILELLERYDRPVKLVAFMKKYYYKLYFSSYEKGVREIRKLIHILAKRGLLKKEIFYGYSYIQLIPQKDKIQEEKFIPPKPEKIALDVSKTLSNLQEVETKADISSQDEITSVPVQVASAPEISEKETKLSEQSEKDIVKFETELKEKERIEKEKYISITDEKLETEPTSSVTKDLTALPDLTKELPIQKRFVHYDIFLTFEEMIEKLDEKMVTIVEQRKTLELDLKKCQKQIYSVID